MRPLAAVLLVAAWVAPAQQPQDAVNLVSQPNYTHYLTNLLYTRSGDSRAASSWQHDAARTNIQDVFTSFGLTTSLHPFQYQDATFYNVVGVLPGKVRPSECHVVGAHYDSVNIAPGADDDASGVAALLEAARVLSMHDLETSIIFIAFDREEAGLIGSQAWVRDHSGYRLLSMLQLDMIAFNPPGPTYNMLALVIGNTNPNPAYAAVENAVRQFGGLTPVNGGVSNSSDHAPFAPITAAVHGIEASFSANTNYHRAGDAADTPGYIDFTYATAVTRVTVGYLATAASLLPQPENTARFSAAGIANAASWVYDAVAPGELVSLIGTGLTDASGKVSVTIRDSAGTEQRAETLYASPRQVNVALPVSLAAGTATMTVTRGDGVALPARVRVDSVAPGLFAANASGQGAAAAQAVRVAPDGSESLQDLFACDLVCAAVPVDFGGEQDRVMLVLYATGIRWRSGLEGVSVDAGGTLLPVQYAGEQRTFLGLDQVTVELPRALRGRGPVRVTLRVDGKWSNPVTVEF